MYRSTFVPFRDLASICAHELHTRFAYGFVLDPEQPPPPISAIVPRVRSQLHVWLDDAVSTEHDRIKRLQNALSCMAPGGMSKTVTCGQRTLLRCKCKNAHACPFCYARRVEEVLSTVLKWGGDSLT